MKTNREEFLPRRKTRLEALEDRILKAEAAISDLSKELKSEGIQEVDKLETALKDLIEIKKNIVEADAKANAEFDSNIEDVRQNSLMILNNAKVEVLLQNEALISKSKDRETYIKKLEDELNKRTLQIEILKYKENELHTTNSELAEDLNRMKSKAYGYDIAKKFEIHKNKTANAKNKNYEDDTRAYDLWEKNYPTNTKPYTKLEELTKQNQMWIGDSSANIAKLLNEIDKSKVEKRENIEKREKSSLNTNMRKYSPLIMNK
jgi:hypothetical protein